MTSPSRLPTDTPDTAPSPVFDREAALALPPGPALRTLFRISDAWKLNRQQTMALIGVDGVTLYSDWKKNPDAARLKLHVIERLSHVFGIYHALHALFPGSHADEWVHRPNSAELFGGRPAIELMTSGLSVDLAAVRRYLDGERYR